VRMVEEYLPPFFIIEYIIGFGVEINNQLAYNTLNKVVGR